jgi:CIC family chloride channel protein
MNVSFSLRSRKWIVLYVFSGFAGIFGGLGAVAFHLLINLSHRGFFSGVLPHVSQRLAGFDLGLVLLPALGGLLIGPLTMRIAPETRGAGIPEVMEAVALNKGRLRTRTVLLKLTASSVSIGSGGSAGREGPIGLIGAAIGSLLGRAFRFNTQDVKLLVVCGLSAGIAGTYNAPLGGALFGIEILLRGIDLIRAVPVVMASVIGAATATAFLGQSPAFMPLAVTEWVPSEMGFYIGLGLLFGIVSILWVKFFYFVAHGFERLRIPALCKPALGGLVVGSLIMLYPEHGVMGVGYDGINRALAGEFTLILLFSLAGAKWLATTFTIGSGGSGGIFAPTLYIGAMLGTAGGLLLHACFPAAAQEPAKYALAGMAALFAGAAQAPLNIMIMIPEMSRNYGLLPPIMASSVTSFVVAWLVLRGSSIYTLKLQARGLDLRMGRSLTLDTNRVEDVMTKNVVTISPHTSARALEKITAETGHRGYPVIERDRLKGMVRVRDLMNVPEESRDGLTAQDLISGPLIVVHPDETLGTALHKMDQNGTVVLPVAARNDPARLLGVIAKHDILQAYAIDSESFFLD